MGSVPSFILKNFQYPNQFMISNYFFDSHFWSSPPKDPSLIFLIQTFPFHVPSISPTICRKTTHNSSLRVLAMGNLTSKSSTTNPNTVSLCCCSSPPIKWFITITPSALVNPSRFNSFVTFGNQISICAWETFGWVILIYRSNLINFLALIFFPFPHPKRRREGEKKKKSDRLTSFNTLV